MAGGGGGGGGGNRAWVLSLGTDPPPPNQMNSEISITVLATGFSLGVTDLVGLPSEEPEPRDTLPPPTMRRTTPPPARTPQPSTAKGTGSGGVPGFLRRFNRT